MPDITPEFSRFEQAMAETPQAWQSLDVRVFAIGHNGEWKNCLTVVRLDLRPRTEMPPFEVLALTSSVLCMRVTLHANELPRLVEEIQTGKARLGDFSIDFLSESSLQRGSPYQYANSRIAAALESHIGANPIAIGHEFMISGDNVSSLFASIRGGEEELSQQLRAADPPWDGLEALLTHAIEAPGQIERDVARFQVRAKLSLDFLHEQLRLQNGFLTVAAVTSSSAFAERCSIGYVALLDDAMVDRGTIQPGPVETWSHEGDRLIWHDKKKIARGDRVTVFLRVGPYVVDRATVVDERRRVRVPLLRAYEMIDPQLALLAKWLLSPGRAEQERFERAVARVFLFCGFAVDTFAGEKRLGEAADLIAHTPELKRLLVVECTTGTLQAREGKLSRLLQRAQAIKHAIAGAQDHSSQLEVIPVIASSLDRVSESDRLAADMDDIIVLTNQSLSRLLSIARTGAGPKAAMNVLRERSTTS